MKSYDWIVIGAGITGASLAYELRKQGFTVLLLEQDLTQYNATRCSYGGLAFWSGTTSLTRQLCAEGIARHRILSQELDTDTEFRELDLLLTIPNDADPKAIEASYAHCAIPPQLLDLQEACEVEPLLNRSAIAGALTVKHGHINPEKTTQGYIAAFKRAGGEMQIAQVKQILRDSVKTNTETYQCSQVVVCAGGLSRQLLKLSGIAVKLYFTHAEVIETLPVDLQLRTLVMPANLQRFQLEANATQDDTLWNQPDNELAPPILDAGAIQFRDRRLFLGQISRVLSNPNSQIDAAQSELELRTNIRKVLPKLADLPGTWRHCLVSFSKDQLPLIGTIPAWEGICMFSGFSNPLTIIPPLAARFAAWASEQEDKILSQFSPARFS